MVSATPAVLAGFAAGVGVLQTRAPLPPAPWAWLVAAVVVATLVAWWLMRKTAPGRLRAWVPDPVRRTCVLVAWMFAAGLAGFGYAALRADNRLADALPAGWEGTDIAIVGVIDGLPDRSERGVRFAFAVEHVATPGAQVPSRISLAWPASSGTALLEDDMPLLAAGERWALVVRLKRPHGYANPGGFDLEAWLLERHLRATGYVREDAGNRRIDAFAGRFRDYVHRARERVRDRIAAALPDERYVGVVAALAVGDQRAIPDEQWTVFNRTGVGHLVSISGLHVTALAALAAWLCALLARRSTRLTDRLPALSAGAIAGVAVAGVYTLLAGAEVPALRTFAMLATGAAGLVVARGGSSGLVWLWALAAVLVLDPWAVLAPGFWLSYGAVALLIWASIGRVAPDRGTAWARRCLTLVREGARTQWIVTVGLVPFVLALFGQVSLVSPVANAIAIPVVTLAVVPLAVAGIVLPGDMCFIAAHALLEPLMRLLVWLAGLPAAAWSQHTPLPWTLAAAAIGVVWLLAPRGVPGRALSAIWLMPLALVTPPSPPEGTMQIAVLDVGQGLAVVVRTYRHALVYDTGPRWHDAADAGSRIVAPYLRHSGIGRVDTLVVSHEDADHSGGALSLLRLVPVAHVLSSLADDHPILAERGSATSRRCVDGQRWRWDGVDFAILHPPTTGIDDDRTRTNDRSCVLAITAGGVRVLLAGDIEARSEARLVRDRRDALAADVLVVPHHGSRTSSTRPFVAAVDPVFAIFASGYRNRFGHPQPEIVARYVARGSRILRTDREGAITLAAGTNEALVAEGERRRHVRYWHDPPDEAGGLSN